MLTHSSTASRQRVSAGLHCGDAVVKSPPTSSESGFHPWVGEDLPEKETATLPPGESHGPEGWLATVHGAAKGRTKLSG